MTEKDFAASYIEKIKNDLKKFPDDFLGNDECEELSLPSKLLFFPPPLFDKYQIIDETGETIYSTDNQYKAKYVIYANRTRPTKLLMPKSDLRVYQIVRDYEKYLDNILKEIEIEFKTNFPNSKGFKRISALIFNSLNISRY
ncbi:hypothetical protein ABRY23_09780 [Melioribacteraceae bacterium 4301-Me]|uniref:hypothetical protein n=1 Tax=Pyranulibacter aquaticus TaxID=3163344 RepID=UPI003594C2BE